MKNPFYESIFNLRKEQYKKDNKSLLTFLPGRSFVGIKKKSHTFIY